MHDLRTLRENFDSIRDRLGPRGSDVPWEELRKLLQERRDLTARVDGLRHRLKQGSDEVASLKRQRQPAEDATERMKALGDQVQTSEKCLADLESRLLHLTLQIPNIPHPQAPPGAQPADNVELRRWGERPVFAFSPRPHWDIGEALGILDFERAARLAGARFAVLSGAGARLERALINFMLDVHTREHDYREVLPPFLVNRSAMTGTGQLPKFEEDMFRLRDEDYFLIPTAEVPVTNLHREEVLAETSLPIRYVAHTPCFRREAGSYGKDTRGLIRQHQFNKVELVAFTRPEESYRELEALTRAAEAVLQRLGLHYRVVELCRGDLGFAATKTYDLEVWLPAQEVFREISSCSNFEAFQARRANIRYRRQGQAKNDFVHTLNGSGLAVGRTLVAILENYQQADGSVVIPQALRPYMAGLERIERK